MENVIFCAVWPQGTILSVGIPVGIEWFFTRSNLEKLKITKTCLCFATFNHVHFKRTLSRFDIRCLWNNIRFIQYLWKRHKFDWDAFDAGISKFYRSLGNWITNFSESTENKILYTTTNTVHSSLAMMALVIMSYNFKYLQEKSLRSEIHTAIWMERCNHRSTNEWWCCEEDEGKSARSRSLFSKSMNASLYKSDPLFLLQ